MAAVIMTVASVPARGQHSFRFHHLTVNDGLSQGFVNAIAQDELGFMWFGTNDGLTRYDGYALKSFRPDPVDSLAVHDHVVASLLGFGRHTLWIGMRRGGIRAMDLLTFDIRQYPLDPDPSALRPHHVVQFFADRQRILWALTTTALYRYDDVADRFNVVSFATFEPGWIGTSLAEDSSGTLWVGMFNGGLWRIPPDRTSWEHVTVHAPQVPASERSETRRLLVDSRNALWFGTSSTLVRIPDKELRVRSGPLRAAQTEPFAFPFAILEEGGRIWFTSEVQTTAIVDPVSGFLAALKHDSRNPQSVSPGNLISGFVDRGGVVWLGSSGYGVSRLATSYRRFPLMTVNAPLSFRSVRSVVKDRRGNVWVGGYPYEGSAGLDRIDRSTGAVNRFTIGTGAWTLPTSSVWSLAEDPDPGKSVIWVGSGSILTRVHTTSGRTEAVAMVEGGRGIRGMAFDRSRRLWIGSQRGLFLFNPSSRTIRQARIDTTRSDPFAVELLHTSEILQITELTATPGRIWCTTTGGMLCYDPSSGIVVAFRQGLTEGRLHISNIQSIVEDESARVWMATGGAGFARMILASDLASRMPSEQDVSFRFINSSHGLANDFVYAVLAGNDGALWMSTNRGLARFDTVTEQFHHYDVSDGLQDNEFNGNAFFRAPDGELFFGGVVGLNSFYPNRLLENPNPPSVVITECRTWGDEMKPADYVPYAEEVIAEASDHTVMFEFVGLDFTAPERNQYRYQLEGFNRSWVESGNKRTATYTNLEPGTYTFRVTASNNDGVWNPTGASIRLVVLPPFWKTIWFRGFMLLAVAGLWLAGVWYRGRQMAGRNRELEQRVRERTAEWEATNSELEAFSYTVSHDLRAPVRAINGYTRMLMEEHATQLSPEAKRMLGVIAARTKRMGDMIDDLLTFSRTGRQAIVHAKIDMTELVKGIATEFVPSDSRIELSVGVLPPVLGDTALLRQVWINLFSNAIKFSSGVERPTITVGGNVTGNSVVYWITDNGVGFDMSYRHKLFGVFERLHSQEEFEGTGVGLAIVARVIHRHGGRIWAEGQPGAGATFSFELPIVPPAAPLSPGSSIL